MKSVNLPSQFFLTLEVDGNVHQSSLVRRNPMLQQELLLVMAGIIILLLLVHVILLRLKLWFIGRAISLLTSWIPGEGKTRTYGGDVANNADIGGAFILFIWTFNIIGLYWILTH